MVLYGKLTNAREREGTTDLDIEVVVKDNPARGKASKLTLARYVDLSVTTNKDRFLVFCDIFKGKVDPYRGMNLKAGSKLPEYLRGAIQVKDKPAAQRLAFFFRYLEDPEPEISADAFLEFARAGDADIARAAGRLDAGKLRAWLKDPRTPPGRLGVYALLLGACGKAGDAEYLRKLLGSTEERYAAAADGILAGYMSKRPEEGWELLLSILGDGRKPLLLRLSALRALRFQQGARPAESRPRVLRAMRALLAQGELADLAVEDLRRWKMWDLTPEVLKLHGRKGLESPLMARAVVRYALCCAPTPESRAFLAKRRAAEPDLVSDVEEGLKLEQDSTRPAAPARSDSPPK